MAEQASLGKLIFGRLTVSVEVRGGPASANRRGQIFVRRPTAAQPEPQRPAYRSPEAVRSRLSSYHQGVRRGRHADRADGDNGERDPSEVLVQQSQEQS